MLKVISFDMQTYCLVDGQWRYHFQFTLLLHAVQLSMCSWLFPIVVTLNFKGDFLEVFAIFLGVSLKFHVGTLIWGLIKIANNIKLHFYCL